MERPRKKGKGVGVRVAHHSIWDIDILLGQARNTGFQKASMWQHRGIRQRNGATSLWQEALLMGMPAIWENKSSKTYTIVTEIITKLIRWEFSPVMFLSKITALIVGEFSSGSS